MPETEITAAARERVKADAARQAVFDNNLAAWCAVFAVVVPAPPAKLAWGVGGGAFWLLANYRTAVALDPPRDDFDQIWEADSDLDESQVPSSEPEGTLHRFAAQALLAADANYALYISMERYDGALAAGDQDAADGQARAAAHNAAAAASHQDALEGLVPSVHDIMSAQIQETDRAWDTVTIDEARTAYTDACGPDKIDLSAGPGISALAKSLVGAADDLLVTPEPELEHPVLDGNSLPALPAVLIDEDYVDAQAAYSASLRDLVTA